MLQAVNESGIPDRRLPLLLMKLAGLNPADMLEFVRRVPDGAVLTLETLNRHIYPMSAMAIAMGLHVRCGIEDNLWHQSGTRKTSTVEQIEQLVRISQEFGRDIATAQQAREICKIGVFYETADEALAANGFAPNRNGGNQGFLQKAA